MYVCVCHGVTDRDIRRAAAEGVSEVHELTMRLGLGSGCGTCRDEAAALLAEARVLDLPILAAAA
jgi:bacterioferritin-associated ferredoxin